jgi:hypothetical protein
MMTKLRICSIAVILQKITRNHKEDVLRLNDFLKRQDAPVMIFNLDSNVTDRGQDARFNTMEILLCRHIFFYFSKFTFQFSKSIFQRSKSLFVSIDSFSIITARSSIVVVFLFMKKAYAFILQSQKVFNDFLIPISSATSA